MKLKKFGDPDDDYTLDELISGIERLARFEEDLPQNAKRAKRLDMVEDALELLNEASEIK